MTYIYALVDPRTNECRYIGKANDPHTRLRKHRTRIGKGPITHKESWFKSVMAAELLPELVILECVKKECWVDAEQFWIQYYKFIGANLTNATKGGEGTEGARLSAEHKRCISERAKLRVGKLNPNYGNHYSEEARQKISAAASGRKLSAEGRLKRSVVMKEVAARPEVRAKAAAHRAKGVSEETREKLSAAGKGRVRPEETCAKLSAALKGRVFSLGHREHIRDAKLGKKYSDETKAKHSARFKGVPKTEEHNKKNSEANLRRSAQKMLETGRVPNRSTIRRWKKNGLLDGKESIQQAILDLARGK